MHYCQPTRLPKHVAETNCGIEYYSKSRANYQVIIPLRKVSFCLVFGHEFPKLSARKPINTRSSTSMPSSPMTRQCSRTFSQTLSEWPYVREMRARRYVQADCRTPGVFLPVRLPGLPDRSQHLPPGRRRPSRRGIWRSSTSLAARMA